MKKNNSKDEKKYSPLNLAEREGAAIRLENGMKQSEIASLLDRCPSTISIEIRRNNPSIRTVRYRANRVQTKTDGRKEQKTAAR